MVIAVHHHEIFERFTSVLISKVSKSLIVDAAFESDRVRSVANLFKVNISKSWDKATQEIGI